MLHEADPGLYRQNGARITCLGCQVECDIPSGKQGRCSGYANEDGVLYDLTYGKATLAQVTKIGWAPVTEYTDPQTPVLSVASRGCNFNCKHCINGDQAWSRHDVDPNAPEVSPAQIVEYAKELNCGGVAGNFNEALLAVRYWRDIFKLAKESDLITVAVTNGYSTTQALDMVAPYLDVYRCDIKAISGKAMQYQGAGIEPEGVFDSLVYMRNNHPQTHIEVVTMLLPGVNDSEVELRGIATWIRNNLGPETPTHISPCHTSGFTRKKDMPRPAYLDGNRLVGRNKHLGMSILFSDDGDINLVAGDWSLDEAPPLPLTPDLARGMDIFQQAGLTKVIPKLDGH